MQFDRVFVHVGKRKKWTNIIFYESHMYVLEVEEAESIEKKVLKHNHTF